VRRIALQEQDDPPLPHDGGGAIPNRSAKEGMDLSMVGSARLVTGGVDTHLDVNVAAALDRIGGLLGVESFPTTVEGNRQLLGWLRGLGRVAQVGVEGTGSYGASLARFLRDAGVEVLEVDRPNRQERRRKGKNDTVDAIEAARAAQGQRQLGAAKTKDGNVEAIRALIVARRSARDMKIASLNQIRHLGFTAPEEIRRSLQGISRRLIAKRAAAIRPRADGDPVVYATKTALRALGRRVLELDAERKELDKLLDSLLAETAPGLVGLYGVGKHSAANLLVAAGDNPDRLRSEAAWARLCGVSPIEASSGKTVRHRLNPGGNRQANAALWHIVVTRMSSDPRTALYVERRTKEGRTKKEIIRILKRYVAREVHPYIIAAV
jgi:transposase